MLLGCFCKYVKKLIVRMLKMFLLKSIELSEGRTYENSYRNLDRLHT